jgi:hypothetical protein
MSSALNGIITLSYCYRVLLLGNLEENARDCEIYESFGDVRIFMEIQTNSRKVLQERCCDFE